VLAGEGNVKAAIAPCRNRKNRDCEHSEPLPEDVFIDLMRKLQDNFQ